MLEQADVDAVILAIGSSPITINLEGMDKLWHVSAPEVLRHEVCPKGKVDNTHLNIYGGKVVAGIAIEAVAKVVPELVPYIRYRDPEVYVADYKDNKECAVSYTFDDGLQEHYTLVFPEMEKVGFKGTFWVCGNTIENEVARQGKSRMTWPQMKEMSDKGHEIAGRMRI